MHHVLALLFLLGAVVAHPVPCEGPQCGELTYGLWIDGSNVTYVLVNNNVFPYTLRPTMPVGNFVGKKIGAGTLVLSQELAAVVVENTDKSNKATSDIAVYNGFKGKLYHYASALPVAYDKIDFFAALPYHSNLQLIAGVGNTLWLVNVPSDYSSPKLTKLVELPTASCSAIKGGTVAPDQVRSTAGLYVWCGEGSTEDIFHVTLGKTAKATKYPLSIPKTARMNIAALGWDVTAQHLWWFGEYKDASLHKMLSLGEVNFTSSVGVVQRWEPITVGTRYLKGNMAMDSLNRLAHIMVEFDNFDQAPTPLMYSLRTTEQGRVYDFAPVTFPACKTGLCRLTATVS